MELLLFVLVEVCSNRTAKVLVTDGVLRPHADQGGGLSADMVPAAAGATAAAGAEAVGTSDGGEVQATGSTTREALVYTSSQADAVAAHVRAFTFILVELCQLQWAFNSPEQQQYPNDTPGYTGSPKSPATTARAAEQQAARLAAQQRQRSMSCSYTKIVNLLVDRLRLDPLRFVNLRQVRRCLPLSFCLSALLVFRCLPLTLRTFARSLFPSLHSFLFSLLSALKLTAFHSNYLL